VLSKSDIFFFQKDTKNMTCAINSVIYNATVSSNTAVCQNVKVSYY